MLRRLLAIGLVLGAVPARAKYTICTATLNSSEEREVFKAKLDPRDFDFRELTELGAGTANQDWFAGACRSGVECDVLVVSGHFAGYFFGNLGLTLDLPVLEKSACQQSCPSVLGHLKEAYLFGCNTLASKDADARTPEQYLAVLLGDGIARPEAERIVAARYGPFGSSYRDRMERLFENTPVLYGFSSVGPSGVHVKASLQNYLTKLGDFKTHLDRVRPGQDVPVWTETMSAYSRARGTGLTKAHPLYPVKENMCSLDDDRRSVAERVGLVADLLDRDPMLYLTAIAHFANSKLEATRLMSDDEDTRDVKSSLRQLVQRRDLASTFEKVQKSPGVTPSIRVDLLGAARNFGWLTTDEFDRRVRELFSGYTKSLDADGADFLCAQMDHDASLSRFFDENDLLGYAYDKWFQFRLASCSQSKNPKLTAAVVAGFERNAARLNKLKIEQRVWALLAMNALKGEDWGRARVLRTFLSYKGPHDDFILAHTRAWLVGLTRGEEQTAFVKKVVAAKKDYPYLSPALEGLAESPERNEAAIRIAIDALFGYSRNELHGLSIPAGLFPETRAFHDELAVRLKTSDLVGEVVTALEEQKRIESPALVDRLVGWISTVAKSDDYATFQPVQTALALLDASDLTEAQVGALTTIYYRSGDYHRPYLRWLLFNRNVDDDSIRRELKMFSRCARTPERGRECRYETKY